MKNLLRSLAAIAFALSVTVAVAQSQPAKDKPAADAAKQQNAASEKPAAAPDKNQKPANSQRSVLDRPLGEKPAPIIVPAGTEIRVDLVDGKVVVPVRVGFSTAIPALSKVAVKIDRVYAPGYVDPSGAQVSAPSRYAEYGELKSITIDGKTYAVESDSVALATPGSSAVTPDNSMGSSAHDVKFVLSSPLAIER